MTPSLRGMATQPFLWPSEWPGPKSSRGSRGWVVAIIGDGAFTGGMVYEGMNNIAALDNLMVILNDNKMSISKKRGGHRPLSHPAAGRPGIFPGKPPSQRRHQRGAPDRAAPAGFSQSGKSHGAAGHVPFHHVRGYGDSSISGRWDGHNEEALERTLRNLCARTGPLFLHVVTTKGKGYPPAEENPGEYHGVSASSPGYVPDPEVSAPASFSTAFGKALCEACRRRSQDLRHHRSHEIWNGAAVLWQGLSRPLF